MYINKHKVGFLFRLVASILSISERCFLSHAGGADNTEKVALCPDRGHKDR